MMLKPQPLRNSFDAPAARQRCRRYRRRILDISQQVTALHVAPAFSCTEITDAIYREMRRIDAIRAAEALKITRRDKG